MTDCYTRYVLECNPFIKNSKEILVDTDEYKETRFRLDYLIKTKGFGILTSSPARGKTTAIIIIDEANYINNTILNDLKLPFNLEMDSRARAAVLLDGLPKLNFTLNLGVREPLRQRIVMNYNLDGMSKEEGRYYISEKLKGAGCRQSILEDGAIEAILNAADRTPRLINKYCNISMLLGDSSRADIITTDIVMQTINDCELG